MAAGGGDGMVSLRGARTVPLAFAVLLVMSLPMPAAAQAPSAAVSLGDSFTSGQAGRWLGNSNDSFGSRGGTDRACQPTPFGCNYDTGRVYLDGSQPPGCARSDVAEILSASIPLQER
ncbi:MAG: hypothetical protein ACR2FZ_00345, partial [Thermoleophilaceae bacterium]